MLPFRELQRLDADLYLQALGEITKKGEPLAWQEVEEYKATTDIDKQEVNLNERIRKLEKEIRDQKMQNGDLREQLEKSETLLRITKDIEAEKERLHKSEIKKMELLLKGAIKKAEEFAQVADKGALLQPKAQQSISSNFAAGGGGIISGGVAYSDDVAVFNDESTLSIENVSDGSNYLDLWIGQCSFYGQNLKEITDGKIQDSNKMLTFLMIDFMDHDMHSSNIAEGQVPNFGFVISFKVDVDDFLLSHLQTDNLKILAFASLGNDALELGYADIPLQDLYERNDIEGVSAVISGTQYVYAKNDRSQIVSSVEYKIRLRYPIHNQIRIFKEKQTGLRQDDSAMEDEYEELSGTKAQKAIESQKRKLVLIIEKAINLPPKKQAFVFYQLQNRDFYTSTQPSPNPRVENQ